MLSRYKLMIRKESAPEPMMVQRRYYLFFISEKDEISYLLLGNKFQIVEMIGGLNEADIE